jgi:hypothetical protein
MSELASGEQSFQIKLEKKTCIFVAWKNTASNIDARKVPEQLKVL